MLSPRKLCPKQPSLVLCLVLCWATPSLAQKADPLPSWNATLPKQQIEAFVKQVTDPDGPGFVPVAERIAVFDNDGTLWAEQPMYTQLSFAIDRVKTMAPEHPDWRDTEPFASILRGDLKGVLAGGEAAILEIVMATHAGMSTAEFEELVAEWIATAKHPVTGRPYTAMTYQPMLELLDYLRANNFKTYIVSGGGVEFMRPWSQRIYDIPPEQVIGSSIQVVLEYRDGIPMLVRQPKIDFIDDKAGKPVGIHKFIGRRPIAAFGNSDGDLQMLEWTMAGQGSRFALYVHHTDAQREFAYDRDSHVGRLDKGLEVAEQKGWTVVDMRQDWKVVFADAKE